MFNTHHLRINSQLKLYSTNGHLEPPLNAHSFKHNDYSIFKNLHLLKMMSHSCIRFVHTNKAR